MDARPSRWFWLVLIAFVAVATAVRIVVIQTTEPGTYFTKYIEFADALLAGTISRDRIPDLSPGYLWTVALLRAAGAGIAVIRAIQIALLSVVALMAGAIASRWAGRAGAVLAVLFVLLNKSAFVNACDFEPETVLLFFSTLGLMLMAGGAGTGRSAWSGLAFGVGVIMRPVVVLPAGLILLWQMRRDLRGAAAFLGGLLLPVVAALAINFQLTGSALLMDPGTVFYEGMNPNATAYAGVAPRIIKDLEPGIGGADAMHVAYRIVASCALGRTVERDEANRYWSSKAWAFARTYPGEAAGLIARKLIVLVSAYNAYDVPSMVLIDRALTAPVWISWAVLFPLAFAGAWFVRREAAPLLLYTIASAVAPVVFFVTARHRNPLVPALAALAAIAVVRLFQAGRRRAIATLLLIALAAAALSIEGDLQREDRFLWTAFFQTSFLLDSSNRHPAYVAAATTWMPESVPAAPPQLVRQIAVRELATTSSPARMMSIAIALLDAGDAARADQILQHLQEIDYRPFRRTRAVSSVAYYRARALAAAGRANESRQQLQRALDEAPGDAHVLALAAVSGVHPDAGLKLNRLHDPMTRDYAMALASATAGLPDAARAFASRAAEACPRWQKPRTLLTSRSREPASAQSPVAPKA